MIEESQAEWIVRQGHERALYEAHKRGWEEGRTALGVKVDWAADELRMMPRTFVDAYGAMWEAGLRHPQGSLRGDGGDIRVHPRVRTSRTSSGQNLTRRGAHPESRSGGSERDVVVSERMVAERARVDRKLRKLARDIEAVLRGERSVGSVGRCGRCGRILEKGWRHCPWDGVEVDQR